MNALPSVFFPEIKKLQNVLFLMQTWSLYYPWRDGRRQQVAQVNVGTLSAQVANLKIKYVGSTMALIVIYIETGIDNMQKVDRLCELWVDCHGLVGCNPHVLSSLIHTISLFAWSYLAYKPWLKVLLADLVWEENTVRWLISHVL